MTRRQNKFSAEFETCCMIAIIVLYMYNSSLIAFKPAHVVYFTLLCCIEKHSINLTLTVEEEGISKSATTKL